MRRILSVLPNKFRLAWRGVRVALAGEINFIIHAEVAVSVIAAAVILECSLVEWSLLALVIALVFAAELFNTAIERLAKSITRETNPWIADALDIAAGAVLMTSLGAALVGSLILGNRLLQWLEIW